MNNILDLLIDYSKNGKLIDLVFLRKVKEIMIKENSLENYIGIISLAPNLSETYIKGCRGYYNFATKDLVICEFGIKESLQIAKGKSKNRISKYEEFLFANVIELQAILHEFEHANQIRKIDLSNDFEGLLLNASCCFDLKFGNDILRDNPDEQLFYKNFNKKNYIFMPSERLAENYSSLQVYDLLKPIFKDIHPGIEREMNRLVEHYIMRGYDENNLEPTERYLFDYECFLFPESNPFLNVEFYDALALEKEKPLMDRLFFGLGITEDEFDKCKLKKKKK